jgi:hypothetical protein
VIDAMRAGLVVELGISEWLWPGSGDLRVPCRLQRVAMAPDDHKASGPSQVAQIVLSVE